MEYEIDELFRELCEHAEDQPCHANHAPSWTRDCMQKQTGVEITEESIQVDLGLLFAE